MERYICVECFTFLPRTEDADEEHCKLEKLFWKQIPIERAAAMLKYNDSTKAIVHAFKYKHKPELATYITKCFLSEVDSSFFNGIDYIIPVPLHPMRLMTRGYNQCEYIAKGVSEMTNIPIMINAVKRTKYNVSQTTRTIEERAGNVKQIFSLVHPELIENKHILIVDDVITTGSTILSIAREIAKAPNVRISIFCIAHAGI